MAFTEANYDNAIRVLFVDDNRKTSDGLKEYRVAPFTLIRVEANSYFEPLPEIEHVNDRIDLDIVLPSKYHKVQDVDMDSPVSYNGSTPPIFEKHKGI